MELVRTKMQAKAMSYHELGKVLRDAIKSEGWLTLWKGLGPQILRDVPYAGKSFKNVGFKYMYFTLFTCIIIVALL